MKQLQTQEQIKDDQSKTKTNVSKKASLYVFSTERVWLSVHLPLIVFDLYA